MLACQVREHPEHEAQHSEFAPNILCRHPQTSLEVCFGGGGQGEAIELDQGHDREVEGGEGRSNYDQAQHTAKRP